MLGRLRSRVMMVAAALLGLGAPAAAVAGGPPIPVRAAVQPTKAVRRQQRSALSSSTWYGRKGAGISMAAQQRASAKRRNVARNRRAHR